jgi:branched-chain amino acid transport system permease protein
MQNVLKADRRGEARSFVLRTLIAIVVLAPLLIAVPNFLSDAWIVFLTGVFIWVAMAWAWDLLATAGYISLAAAGWYGLGAYSTVVLMGHFGFSFYAAVLMGALFTAIFSVIVAVPLFRLRSHYFIMGTLIIAEVIFLVMNEVRMFGIQGASLVHFPPVVMEDPSFYNRYFYLLSLGFLAISLFVVVAVRRSRMGLALRAIGQDEVTAETMGVATARYKLLAFGISSAILAMAGGLSGYWVGSIQQGTVFTLMITVKLLVIVIMGGSGTLVGPLVGLILIQYVEQVMGPTLAALNPIIYGLIVMVVAVLLPRGIVPSAIAFVKDRVAARKAATDAETRAPATSSP